MEALQVGEAVCAAARQAQDTLRLALGLQLIGQSHRLSGETENNKAASYLRQSLQFFHSLGLAEQVAFTRRLISSQNVKDATAQPVTSSTKAGLSSDLGLLLSPQMWAPEFTSLVQK